MPPHVIDVRRAEDSRDVVHRAVQALAEGNLVAFPTETVYGLAASALSEQGVKRLMTAKQRAQGNPLTLAIKSADDALDYVPDISPLGQRLARRCWPGPVTLVLGDNHPDSLIRQLPESVRGLVVPGDTIGLRVPAHPLILDVLRLLAGPLALSSANLAGGSESITAQEVVDSLGEAVQLVLDDGRSQFGQPSSVVKVEHNRLEILRAGVVGDSTLQRLSSFMILMVCTGNTCRSPMAELLCRRQLARRLGCEIEQIEDRGVLVDSAGIAAMAGGRPSAEAVQVMTERGLDLAGHESQPLSDRLVQHADAIFTMTHSHRETIIAHWPAAAARVRMLCQDQHDVSDPIGASVEMYARCAKQIDAAIIKRIEELDVDSIISTKKDQ
jgi:protein-tyrosine phosphatase